MGSETILTTIELVHLAYLERNTPENIGRLNEKFGRFGLLFFLQEGELSIDFSQCAAFDIDQLVSSVKKLVLEQVLTLENLQDFDVTKGYELLARDNQIFKRFESVQRRRPLGNSVVTTKDHIIAVTSGLISRADNSDLPEFVLLLIERYFHDLGKYFLIEKRDDGSEFVGNDDTQDHALISAKALELLYSNLDFSDVIIDLQTILESEVVSHSTQAVLLHHIAEQVDYERLTTEEAANLINIEWIDHLVNLILDDAQGSFGAEHFVTDNIRHLQRIYSVVEAESDDTNNLVLVSSFTRNITALIDNVSARLEQFAKDKLGEFLSKIKVFMQTFESEGIDVTLIINKIDEWFSRLDPQHNNGSIVFSI